jgi:hypothetical protein
MESNRKGSTGGGRYGALGTGNTAAIPADSSVGPMSPHSSPESSIGETSGVGSTYSAQFNERVNLSNNRNQGPSRDASLSGSRPLPVVSRNSRNTGRVG